VFVQRDYAEGNGVQFLMRFPAELEDKIEKEQFDYTVKMMNNMYAEAGKANCSTFCEGSMACMVSFVKLKSDFYKLGGSRFVLTWSRLRLSISTPKKYQSRRDG
jgi:hypothetical protein